MAVADVRQGRHGIPGRHLVAAGLVASLLLSAAVFLLRPTGTPIGSSAYLVPVIASTVALAVAARRIPGPRRRPWNQLLIAMTLYLAGETFFAVLDVRGYDSWPTPADALLLAGAVPVTLGLLGLGRQRGDQDRSGFLDAAIVALSAATLFVTFVVVPLAADGSQTALARVVGSVYPVPDVLWVFLLTRLLTAPGRRTAAFWWLTAGTASTLVADVAMNVRQVLGTTDNTPLWMNVLWLFFYVAFAVAAWCEAESAPSEERAREERGLTGVRLVVLALAATLPSGILLALAAAHHTAPTVWLALGSLLLIALVVVRIYDLLQQVRSQAAQLAALARTDPLTGVANRRTWDHELTRTCARVARTGRPLIVALLDLDHFKAYNDTHGHQAGDVLLKHAAAVWKEALGDDGFVARWGGEEFAVMIAEVPPAEALERIDALRALIGEGQTCSIGVARWDGAESAFDLVKRADEALYQAKRTGRDRLCPAPELKIESGTDLTAWGPTFAA